MVRKMALSVCLMAGCIWCLALVTRANSAQPVSEDVFQPATTVHTLMYGQLTFFKQMGNALRDKNTKDRMEVLEESAGVLAELANVNGFHKDKDDYRTWARELRDQALQFSKEAGKEGNADEAKLARIFEQMKATCGSCHDVYQ